MFWKFLFSVTEAWIFGVACFLYFRYLPPAIILIPALFVISTIASIAIPVALIIWGERGFGMPGIFWLLLNTLGAYLLTGVVMSSQNVTLWLAVVVAGFMVGFPISMAGLRFSRDT